MAIYSIDLSIGIQEAVFKGAYGVFLSPQQSDQLIAQLAWQ
jgi:hypothetical protein